MIDDLLTDLRRDEGFVPHAYQDHLGFWTLGYGFLIDERRGGEIPEKVAEEWLRHAASTRWWQLCTHLPWLLEQPEDVQRALGNLCYNIGVNGVLLFKKTLAAIKDGDYEKAADEALNSRWAKQVPSRAKRVTDLIRNAR